MPVCGTTGRECPSNCLNRDAMPYMDVLSYVYAIVKISKIALTELLERYDGSDSQKEAYQQNLLFPKCRIHPIVTLKKS
jgi:hypothetical protein